MIAARLDPLIGGDLNSILPAQAAAKELICKKENRKLEGRKNKSGAQEAFAPRYAGPRVGCSNAVCLSKGCPAPCVKRRLARGCVEPPLRVDRWLRLRQPQRIAPRRLRSFIASAMAYPKLSTLPWNA